MGRFNVRVETVIIWEDDNPELTIRNVKYTTFWKKVRCFFMWLGIVIWTTKKMKFSTWLDKPARLHITMKMPLEELETTSTRVSLNNLLKDKLIKSNEEPDNSEG